LRFLSRTVPGCLLVATLARSSAAEPSGAATSGGLETSAAQTSAKSIASGARSILLFVDADDEDDDGVVDGQQDRGTSSEIQWLERLPDERFHLRGVRGRAVRVVSERGRFDEGTSLAGDTLVERLGLQGVEPGLGRVELAAKALDIRVYELRALDGAGRPVDMVASHASLSRTLPEALRPEEERHSRETDALRWLLIGPEHGMPDAVSFVSTASDGRPIDAIDGVALRPVKCPLETPKGLGCRESRLVRATTDWLDRSHPRDKAPSLHAEVGGRLVVFSAGLKAASIRVGGPRETRLGPLERYRGSLRVRVLRTGPGAGVAIGADVPGGLAVARRELETANAGWGQCGIQFGTPGELDVQVVDPPPPHLFAIGCGLGLPASGGRLAFSVGNGRIELSVREGASADRVARDLAAELRRRGFRATLSANPKESFSAGPSVDVLVRGARGEYVKLDLPPIAAGGEPSLEVCLGAVNLMDGLSHFSDADAAAGTVEERTLLKALVDDDPTTIDVLVIPHFLTLGRIGESFVDARGLGVRNAIIIDRAAVRAGPRSFALAHELGHVLLQVAGHPDDFGADLPTRLMDADAADPTVFGPRRLSVSECERAILQSGPGAPLPLLDGWPLLGER
jgi:hypothetical protein